MGLPFMPQPGGARRPGGQSWWQPGGGHSGQQRPGQSWWQQPWGGRSGAQKPGQPGGHGGPHGPSGPQKPQGPSKPQGHIAPKWPGNKPINSIWIQYGGVRPVGPADKGGFIIEC